MFRWLTFFLLLALVAGADGASSESTAFKAASNALSDRNYRVAERWFEKFVTDFPKSPLRAEAFLRQAQSRFFLTNYPGSIELLRRHAAESGAFADQYRFWEGESLFRLGDFPAAAVAYHEVTAKWPASEHFLAALLGEAESRVRLGQHDGVITLLQKPEGDFQKVAAAQPSNPSVVRGRLLLAETLFTQGRVDEVGPVLSKMTNGSIGTGQLWYREHLLARVLVSQGKLVEALTVSTNLLALPVVSSDPHFRVETLVLLGDILEKRGELEPAIEVYQKILSPGISDARRNAALMRMVTLSLRQNRIPSAMQHLETFLQQFPTNQFSAEVRLTLGELKLKEYLARLATNAPAASMETNRSSIRQAFTNFSRLIADFPTNHLVPKAQLGQGWCFWLEDNFESARASFSQAAEQLPHSQERAIAAFKLGDADFKLGQYASSFTNYQRVVEDFSDFPDVQTNLAGQALYQMVRSAIALTNLDLASMALQKLLGRPPQENIGEPAMLLYGQAAARERSPAEARVLLETFATQFPLSPLLPQVQSALARTYVQEGNWESAFKHYDGWLGSFTNHPARPTNEYMRAWVHYQWKEDTNSLALLTNFLASYPSNFYAAHAQLAVADFYWNRHDLNNAQLNYQKLFENRLTPRELAYQAQKMGSRAAFEAGLFPRAREILTALVNDLVKDTQAPPGLLGEALYELGDTRFTEFMQDPDKSMENFNQALEAFARITRDFTNHPIAAMAWGRMGDCHYQLAGLAPAEPEHYKRATNAYTRAIHLPVADAKTRCIALMGLGNAHLRKGDPEIALHHYSTIIYENNPIPEGGADPFWVREAGLAAGRILENKEEWESALHLYQRLREKLPALGDALDKKMEMARRNLNKN